MCIIQKDITQTGHIGVNINNMTIQKFYYIIDNRIQ